METPISLLICMAVATLTVALGIYLSIVRLRNVKRPTLDEACARNHQIIATLERLSEMNGEERRAACRMVARAIRDDCRFLMGLICEAYLKERPRNEEIKRLQRAAFRETRQVLSSVNWLLILLRFRPSLVKDCSEILDATFRHHDSWFAYIRLLRAQYPDLYGNLSIPEESA